MNVIETLQGELTELQEKLASIDQKYKEERPGIISQIAQLNKAINALSKPAGGARKPMSEAGKAAIKAGLEKARAAKAAGAAPAVAAPVAKPVPPQSEGKGGKFFGRGGRD